MATVGTTAGPGSQAASGPSADVARNRPKAPTSVTRSTSFAFQPRPVTCHVALNACSSVPTTPSPAHSRPTSPTIDAARLLCSASLMASRTWWAASPVRPNWSTTLWAKSVRLADRKPRTATPRSSSGNSDRKPARVIDDAIGPPPTSDTRWLTAIAVRSHRNLRLQRSST